ncbi:hypothetical protein CBS101457_005807 [Exobasidium rhododendri]|nr:hypothetical protein CBS101457_005807 [Exobasidium rhododendri]
MLFPSASSCAGPQQLFADLKNNSAKKASSSSAFSKSPSRALGVKNTQSPQRSREGPIKPTIGKARSAQDPPAEVSPTKGKSTLRSPSKSENTVMRQVSPTREGPISFATSPSKELEEGASYHTIATPHPAEPTTPTAVLNKERSLQRQSSFVTPAANIGQAGAMRLRKGEMLDALTMAEEGTQLDEAKVDAVQEANVEETYPEIEYIPPRVEVPFDFPLELDDLPRGQELGEKMTAVRFNGFYQPSNEEKKQEMLAEVFKFRPGPIDKPNFTPVEVLDEHTEWPDVEIKMLGRSKAASEAMMAPLRKSGDASVVKKKILTKSTGASRPPTNERPIVNRPSASVKSSSVLPSKKPKALGERNSNAIITRKVMNPALRDFENDQMGKIIKAKLKASEGNEPEGFML